MPAEAERERRCSSRYWRDASHATIKGTSAQAAHLKKPKAVEYQRVPAQGSSKNTGKRGLLDDATDPHPLLSFHSKLVSAATCLSLQSQYSSHLFTPEAA